MKKNDFLLEGMKKGKKELNPPLAEGYDEK
jgi:hypothetical protein